MEEGLTYQEAELQTLYEKAKTMDKESKEYAELIKTINSIEDRLIMRSKQNDEYNIKMEEIDIRKAELESRQREIERVNNEDFDIRREELAIKREEIEVKKQENVLKETEIKNNKRASFWERTGKLVLGVGSLGLMALGIWVTESDRDKEREITVKGDIVKRPTKVDFIPNKIQLPRL